MPRSLHLRLSGSSLSFAILAFLSGCGTRSHDDAPDASSAAGGTGTTIRRDALRIAQASVFGKKLDQKVAIAHLRDEIRAGGLRATLPADIAQPLVLNTSDADGWIALSALAVHATGHVESGLVRYDAASEDLDVLALGTDREVEELRVLHSAKAAHTARYAVAMGPGIKTMRIRDGRVEAVDARGEVRIASDRAFAVDATGTRRDLTVMVDAGIVTFTLDPAGLVYPVVVDPSWVAATSMKSPRTDHQALLLPTGKVLLTGGRVDALSTVTAATDIFDPVTASFTKGPDMTLNRINHIIAPLLGGKVLVATGYNGGLSLSSSEIYDPATSKFTVGPAMSGPREAATATVLTDNKVLVSGGGLQNSQTYDPASNTWGPAANMKAAHSFHTATRLLTGKVLVTGGFVAGGATNAVEIFDPASSTWTLAAFMRVPRRRHLAAPLPDGRVLVMAGEDGAGTFLSAEIYDPVKNTWTDTDSLKSKRIGGSATVLKSGQILIAGGATNTAEIYDPTTGLFAAAVSLNVPRSFHTATLLADGRVLVAGGVNPATDTPVTSAEVYTPLLLGEKCGNKNDCASGFCVDGVCCDKACAGQCEACDLPGKSGTCTNVSGEIPRGTRASCSGYVCDSGVCATACVDDKLCAPTAYCESKACVPKKAKGAVCKATNECATGNCVDGVCCDKACAGQCEACDLEGSKGTCGVAVGVPHGSRTACVAGATTTCGLACDGKDGTKCQNALATAACSETACKAGKSTKASTCDGAGICKDVAVDCAPFACGATDCKTACTTKDDCATGFACVGDKCVAGSKIGEICTTKAACLSGFCTDGACCDVDSCGAGKSCGTTTKKGSCATADGSTCAADTDCGSGICADGVCCDTKCDGTCEACNQETADGKAKKGVCSVVTGAPAKGHPACDTTGEPCRASTCDGTDRKACTKFPDAAVECVKAKCEGGSHFPKATCDGKGTCGASTTVKCGNFACNEVTGCKSSCSAKEDCAAGFVCVSGTCQGNAKCSADGLTSVAGDGVVTACSPYMCNNDSGLCRVSCLSATECSNDFVCNAKTSRCEPPPPPPADDGCAVATPGSSGSGIATSVALLGLALMGVGAARRRRGQSG